MLMVYQIIFYCVIFISAFTIAYVVVNAGLRTISDKHLESLLNPNPSQAVQAFILPLRDRLKRWIERLASIAMNDESWLTSPLQIRFTNAGLNRPNVVALYFASKSLLTITLPVSILLASLTFSWDVSLNFLLAVMLAAATFGYYFPNAVLSHWVTQRQNELFRAFPDALDLLRVCVEAGLGLDAAVERVGREIQIECQALAQEFSLLGLELRAGAARADALRNLALRIGLVDIDALVSMLIQADRFGTSVAESLKVHSESLRTKRRLAAEEAAAKLPVKILLPLIFCVFPALLTVLLGPAIINVSQIFLPQLAAP
jgi:tight adherence protein C